MERILEPSQFSALYLLVTEANALLRRVQNSSFLRDRGIEVYTVSAEPMTFGDGSKHDAVTMMVRAETDMACGMGVGFITALSEGVR